jgi:hypothetical protein
MPSMLCPAASPSNTLSALNPRAPCPGVFFCLRTRTLGPRPHHRPPPYPLGVGWPPPIRKKDPQNFPPKISGPPQVRWSTPVGGGRHRTPPRAVRPVVRSTLHHTHHSPVAGRGAVQGTHHCPVTSAPHHGAPTPSGGLRGQPRQRQGPTKLYQAALWGMGVSSPPFRGG